jgi:hypothetical protein
LRSLTITEQGTKGRGKPETILLSVAYGGEGGTWGELEPLRETTWAQGIQVVSGEVLSNALHGFTRPLFQVLGWEVAPKARRVSDEEGLCSLKGAACLLWDAGLCRPGGRRGKEQGPPRCYEPPLASGTDPAVVQVFREVARAWQAGRHVVVVNGPEFSLR